CLPDERAEQAAERARQWHSSLKPMTAFDTWLVELIATEAVRIEACRVREVQLLTEQARRADEAWDDDRQLAAAPLAARLGARPEVVAQQLLETTQGLDLLWERWAALGAVLERRDWTEDERTLALDLLGVPGVLRAGPTPLGETVADRRALVARKLARLRARQPMLEARDGREQAAAMLGLGAPNVELTRLQRYEAACQRRLYLG